VHRSLSYIGRRLPIRKRETSSGLMRVWISIVAILGDKP
jgi:hypothetical protein